MTITQEWNMETKQKTPFFHLLFPKQLIEIFISEFENTQNSISCGPFGRFLSFWSKATYSDSSSHFSGK